MRNVSPTSLIRTAKNVPLQNIQSATKALLKACETQHNLLLSGEKLWEA